MLVARRDPPFDGDARDINIEANPGSRPPRTVRFVTVIQMIGSLLAVPVGIGSAHTFYRANFSPETTCQSLRSGVIAMLDKGVDASTRRILVRRDVETFEKTCAAVDPEATAAFKALLATEKSPPGGCRGACDQGPAERRCAEGTGPQSRTAAASDTQAGHHEHAGSCDAKCSPGPFRVRHAMARCRSPGIGDASAGATACRDLQGPPDAATFRTSGAA